MSSCRVHSHRQSAHHISWHGIFIFFIIYMFVDLLWNRSINDVATHRVLITCCSFAAAAATVVIVIVVIVVAVAAAYRRQRMRRKCISLQSIHNRWRRGDTSLLFTSKIISTSCEINVREGGVPAQFLIVSSPHPVCLFRVSPTNRAAH